VSRARDGVRIAVRLTPGAKTAGLTAVVPAPGGGQLLRVSVTEPAENGRANAALLRLLATAWRLRRGDLAIIGGTASRYKTVLVSGDPQRLHKQIAAVIAALPHPSGDSGR
jgi:uncharacterized protein YggU (UPF0235/DUF167 family)